MRLPLLHARECSSIGTSEWTHVLRAETRDPRDEIGGPRAESREPRAEGRGPRAEGRESRESRQPRAECGEPSALEPRVQGREPSRAGGPLSAFSLLRIGEWSSAQDQADELLIVEICNGHVEMTGPAWDNVRRHYASYRVARRARPP